MVDGMMDLTQLENSVRKNAQKNKNGIKTGLICVENPINGIVAPLSYMKAVHDIGKKYGIPVHLDGARVFLAAAKLNVDIS